MLFRSVYDKGGKELVNGTDFKVQYQSGRTNVGSYSVKITLMGDYSGEKIVKFKIVPKGTTISKLTKASKAFTVKWKKQSAQTSGYQIQYATNKDFNSAKTVTVSGATNTSKKITGLSKKKTYYVRIRTYKTVSGTKYTSSWSASKSVKTK